MSKTAGKGMSTEGIRAGYIAVLVAAGVLYVISCAPGVLWQDSGLIQYRVWHNDIEGNLGLALAHPLFYIIAIAAKYIPLGEFGYRVNLTNAIISAFAVANLFLLLALWLRNVLPAVVGAMTLALSHTFWQHAAMPEVYNLSMALLLLELVILLQYAKTEKPGWLYGLALVNGLAIANHMFASIPLACYLILVVMLMRRRRITGSQILAMAFFWILGALPYEYLIIKDIALRGDFRQTLSSAAFGVSYKHNVLNVSLSARIVKENLMWIALNFPTPNALLAFVGIAAIHSSCRKRWFANIILALSALFLLFAFRYTVVDRYAFFIPFYCTASILIGVGAAGFLTRRRSRTAGRMILALSLLTIPAYFIAPKVAKRLNVITRPRNIPYRDDYVYFLRPWKTGYLGTEQFSDCAFRDADRNALVFADSTTAPPLLYAQQVKGQRTDLKIISDVGSSADAPKLTEETVQKILAERKVYVVTPTKGYCPELLLERCTFEQAGVIYRAIPR
ncbi:MAG: DUF2723 domain-containing protein [Sedimentisphaerales bacterium]|nr:DUF2723 domain-containing protein [Sedimentisphaerales bacterium]